MALAIVIAQPWAPGGAVAAPEVMGPFQLAQAEPEAALAAPLSFVVRFRGSGPIARAQAMAAQGRESQGARQVQVQLARQGAFNGLCFDRFTLGAAEIVLRSCADIAPAERARVQTWWLARLNAMRAVEYADANANAAPSRAPG